MFRFRCLNRYVFQAWLFPFLGILVLVSLVFMLQKFLFWLPNLIENDVPFALSMTFFVSMIPSILVLVIPLSYFFALYRTVKQFQASSELDAMYAGGLSLFNIFYAVFLAGLLLSVFLLWMTMEVVPASKLEIQNMAQKLGALRATPSFVPQRFTDIEGITFYSEGQNKDGSYHQVFIADARENIHQPTIYLAYQAVLRKTQTGLWIQLKGGSQLSGSRGKPNWTQFDEYLIQVPVAFERAVSQLTQDANYMYMDGSTLYQKLHETGSVQALAEWSHRWLSPVMLMVLFFLAIPLSLQAKRAQKGSLFIVALLAIAAMQQSQLVLAKKISLEVFPWWYAWVLEALYAGIAVFLFMQVNQYGSLSIKHIRKVFS